MSQKKKFVKKGRIYRSLVASALIANGIFQFVAPVLAQATSAGGEIKNSATATYEDPNNPNTPINTTSNEVVVQVAEVAGITVTTAGTTPINDADGDGAADARSEEHTSELQSPCNLVCRLLLEKKKQQTTPIHRLT